MRQLVLFCFPFAALLLIVLPDGEEKRQPEQLAVDGVLIGHPLAFCNLTIFPLYLRKVEDVPDYITLREAQEKGLVVVRETGASDGLQMGQQSRQGGAQVNAVVIENKSKRPLYILAGEVIIGGKQDRVVTRDTIVPAGAKKTVEVCCVEQGRWSPRGRDEGKTFKASKCVAQACLRRVTQHLGQKGQGVVWKNVEKVARELKAISATQTYKEVLEKTETLAEKYEAAFRKALAEKKEVCGFVVAINGKIELCDLFCSPKLLAKFSDMLLRGYAVDAVAARTDKAWRPATLQDAKKFVEELLAARKKDLLSKDTQRILYKTEGKKVLGFENCLKNGNLLHLNGYIRKK